MIMNTNPGLDSKRRQVGSKASCLSYQFSSVFIRVDVLDEPALVSISPLFNNARISMYQTISIGYKMLMFLILLVRVGKQRRLRLLTGHGT